MLLPALSAARDRARQAVCMSNIRQIGISNMMYADMYDEFMPSYDRPAGPMRRSGVLEQRGVWLCPSETTERLYWDTATTWIYDVDYGIERDHIGGTRRSNFGDGLRNTKLSWIERTDVWIWAETHPVAHPDSSGTATIQSGSGGNPSGYLQTWGYPFARRHSARQSGHVLYLNGHIELVRGAEFDTSEWRNANRWTSIF